MLRPKYLSISFWIAAISFLLLLTVLVFSGLPNTVLSKEKKAADTLSVEAEEADGRSSDTENPEPNENHADDSDSSDTEASDKSDKDNNGTHDANANDKDAQDDPQHAETVTEKDADINTITCREFLDGTPDDKDFLIIWLDGFMSASSESSLISKPWIARLDRHIKNFCAKNATKTLMDAVDAMPAGEL